LRRQRYFPIFRHPVCFAHGTVRTSRLPSAFVAAALRGTRFIDLNVKRRLALGRSFLRLVRESLARKKGRIDTDARIGTIGTSD